MGSHTISPPNDPVRQILDSLRRVVHGLRVADRAAERAAGLSGAQLFVLSKLDALGPGSINDLAARTITHQSSVSVVAHKLVERGLAARAPSSADGRRVVLRITAAGRKALRAAPEAAQEKLIAAVGKMKPDEQMRLSRLLRTLVAAAGLDQTEPVMFMEEMRHDRKGT
jgi:DNA-binding MarR family transcriptional regulator